MITRAVRHNLVISPFTGHSPIAPGMIVQSGANLAWPTANKALFFPFVLDDLFTVSQAYYAVGSVSSGNLDIGIYDATGRRLASTGSQAVGATGNRRKLTLAVTLYPGLFYVAMAVDNTSAELVNLIPAGNELLMLRAWGLVQQTSAFPLPATATFAAYSQTSFPIWALVGNGLVGSV